MPALLDVQRVLRSALMGADATSAPGVASLLRPDDLSRLAIYRNTMRATLVNALRLSYPVVQRLVGAEFFEGAAIIFIDTQVPARAYLNDYGANFAAFLQQFEPAASLPYLPDVARLEWAVNQALHAPDVASLDLGVLASIDRGQLDSEALSQWVLRPHPALQLLCTDHPADAIWRAVLMQDDAAIAAIDPAAGPAWLLVERERDGSAVEVLSLPRPEWEFVWQLARGTSLGAALDALEGMAAEPVLARQLAAGRFVDIKVPT